MAKETTKPAAAPKYTAAELAKAAKKVFKTSPDIVTAALRMAGVTSATVAEAEDIIKKYANKEVK
jgi:hypothetical protein